MLGKNLTSAAMSAYFDVPICHTKKITLTKMNNFLGWDFFLLKKLEMCISQLNDIANLKTPFAQSNFFSLSLHYGLKWMNGRTIVPIWNGVNWNVFASRIN